MGSVLQGLKYAPSYVTFGLSFVNPTNYIGGVSFNPTEQIEDLTGKVILITGGNGGLGKETVLQLAKHNPSKIFLGARSEKKAKDAISDIKSQLSQDVEIIWLPTDLSSTESVIAAVKTFHEHSNRLDRLILNAGIMATPPGTTKIGHEIQFGTNHTGHFLLTYLLLPTLLKTAEEPGSDVRVVTLSSVGHNFAPSFKEFINQPQLNKADPQIRYGAAKASNILFAAELARRHPSITSVAVHPGVIMTDLYNSAFERYPGGQIFSKIAHKVFTQIPQGALNQLWAAAGAKKSDLMNGAYYVPVGHHKPHNAYAKDETMGRTLWDWTEAELKRAGVIE